MFILGFYTALELNFFLDILCSNLKTVSWYYTPNDLNGGLGFACEFDVKLFV